MKNKKGATPLSIFLLVMAALALSTIALFVFITGEKNISKKIYDARFIEEVYVEEEQISFFIKDIGERVLRESDYNFDNFKENLRKEILKIQGDELESLKEKFISGEFSVSQEKGKIVLKIEPEIRKKKTIRESSWFSSEDKIREDVVVVYSPEIVLEFESERKI